tara:strand:+ start:1493 stop:1939 length:447 start_codon:yes stop_codon:yes gene_type:complete
MKTSNAVIAIIGLIALLMAFSGKSEADEIEYRVNIGLFTEHYLHDSDELNEDNNLIQLTAERNGRLISGATFINSHNEEGWSLGYGREKKLTKEFSGGGYISVVKGYEGHMKTHYEGLLLAPTLFINYRGVTLSIIPAAYVIGYEFKL